MNSAEECYMQNYTQYGAWNEEDAPVCEYNAEDYYEPEEG